MHTRRVVHEGSHHANGNQSNSTTISPNNAIHIVPSLSSSHTPELPESPWTPHTPNIVTSSAVMRVNIAPSGVNEEGNEPESRYRSGTSSIVDGKHHRTPSSSDDDHSHSRNRNSNQRTTRTRWMILVVAILAAIALGILAAEKLYYSASNERTEDLRGKVETKEMHASSKCATEASTQAAESSSLLLSTDAKGVLIAERCPAASSFSASFHIPRTLWIPSSEVIDASFLRARRGRMQEQVDFFSMCRTEGDSTSGKAWLPVCCSAESASSSSSSSSSTSSSPNHCSLHSQLNGFGSLPYSAPFGMRVDHSWGNVMGRLHTEESKLPWPDMVELSLEQERLHPGPPSYPAPFRPTRIMFVVDELSDTGLSASIAPFGGAGTAAFLLAKTLAQARIVGGFYEFDVHILHTRAQHWNDDQKALLTENLLKYRLTVHILPHEIVALRQENTYLSSLSYKVFLYLLSFEQYSTAASSRSGSNSRSSPTPELWKLPFSIIHFSDWLGLGYFAIQAKRQQWAFKQSVIVVTTHGSTLWTTEGNRKYVSEIKDLETQWMERVCIEGADLVLSPSQYMANWMEARAWKLSGNGREGKRVLVLKNIMPEHTRRSIERTTENSDELSSVADESNISVTATPDPTSTTTSNQCELVFFGRLESRKGIFVFLDALDILFTQTSESSIRKCSMTFLGRTFLGAGSVQPNEIKSRLEKWSNRISEGGQPKFLTTFSRQEALDYLSDPSSGTSKLILLPSPIDNSPYVVGECLVYSLPFLAADTGGIPELIFERDRAHVLFEPKSWKLAERLKEVLALPEGSSSNDNPPPFQPRIARSAQSPQSISSAHVYLHRELTKVIRARKDGSEGDSGEQATMEVPEWQNFLSPLSAPAPPTAELPLVSICVTHFNRTSLLAHTLKAIQKQSYPTTRIQVVILDDGTVDEAKKKELHEAIQPFLDQGPHQPGDGASLWSFHSITNSYLGSARNQCRRWMQGEWLLFLDDDDVPRAEMVERLVSIGSETNAQILSTMFQLFWGRMDPAEVFDMDDSTTTVRGGPVYPKPTMAPGSSQEEHDLNRQSPALFSFAGDSLTQAFFLNVLGGANVFIRSCVYDILGGFSEYVETGYEDYEFLLNALIHQVRHEVVQDPLLLVRRQLDRSSMQSVTSTYQNRQRILLRFFDSFSHPSASLDLSSFFAYVWKIHSETQEDGTGGTPAGLGDSLLFHSRLAGSNAPSHLTSHEARLDLGVSTRDFSPVQGQYGWFYFFVLLTQDPTGDGLDKSVLETLPSPINSRSRGAKLLSSQFESKPFPRWTLGPGAPPRFHENTWPHFTPTQTHPAVLGSHGTVHTIRRWVSQWQGSARIEIRLGLDRVRECGDGVTYHVYHNTERIWRHSETNIPVDSSPHVTPDHAARIAGESGFSCLVEGNLVACEIDLKVGSRLEFIVSPGLTENCDSTELTVHIEKMV